MTALRSPAGWSGYRHASRARAAPAAGSPSARRRYSARAAPWPAGHDDAGRTVFCGQRAQLADHPIGRPAPERHASAVQPAERTVVLLSPPAATAGLIGQVRLSHHRIVRAAQIRRALLEVVVVIHGRDGIHFVARLAL